MKIEISHHDIKGGEFKNVKPLVFVVDEPKVEVKNEGKKSRKKKVAGGTMNMKNFGSHLSIPKVKSSELLILAWRCRFLGWLSPSFDSDYSVMVGN